MKRMLIVALLLSSSAFAGITISDATIENVRVRTWTTYIKLEECPKYSKIKLDTEYGKAMYSTALTAFATDKKVKIGLVLDDGCNSSESELEYIDVSK